MNENAIANMVTDMTFLEGEVARIGRGHLKSSFVELHSVCTLTTPPFFPLALIVIADGQDCSHRCSARLYEPQHPTSIVQRSQTQEAAGTFGEAC